MHIKASGAVEQIFISLITIYIVGAIIDRLLSFVLIYSSK